MHPFRIIVPVVLIGIFLIYILYLSFVKKDIKTMKKVLYPGLFFIAVWAILLVVLFK